MTSPNDVKCNLRKNKIDHWLLKDVKHEFTCENTNDWDPHPVRLTNTEIVGNGFTILADGIRGPQIATH